MHRPDLEHLPDYDAPDVVDPTRVDKLDANENPYGPSPRAVRALAEMRGWQYYAGQEELRADLAVYLGVQAEKIVVTNGADECIDLVLRAVLEPGDILLDFPPTFEMYHITALAHRGRVVDVHRREDFSLGVDEAIRTCERDRAKALAVCSPNNPDGGLLPRAELLRLLDLPALVIMDEAYAEFSGESGVDLLKDHDNLVILRTFSKWAGLAGLRIGYAAMSERLARAVRKLKAPYNVNAAGALAARASLADREYLMGNVAALIAERERLAAELIRLGGFHPLPGRGNFVLCRVTALDAHTLRAKLAARGILIRQYKSPRLRDYVRITAGKPEQTDRVLAAVREIVSEEEKE